MDITEILLTLAKVIALPFLLWVGSIFILFRPKAMRYHYRLFISLLSLFLAVASIKLITNICATQQEMGNDGVGYAIYDGVVYSLQSFTLDADYGTVLKEYRGAVDSLNPTLSGVCSQIIAIINLSCPALSAIIGVSFVTLFFPRIGLFMRCVFQPGRPIYYFSELNNNSVTLSESIIAEDKKAKKRKSIIVFFNVDRNDENKIELINKAEVLNALFINQRLSSLHWILRKKRKRYFYLIDQGEENNLKCLAELTDENNKRGQKALKGASNIYVFGNSESGQLIVNSISKKLDTPSDRKEPKKNNKNNVLSHERDEIFEDQESGNNNNVEKVNKSSIEPKVMLINPNQCLVFDLLSKKPLFLSWLLGEKTDNKLRITIIGTGSLGMEMFFGAYWCGQLLDTELHISVVSNETEESFVSRVDDINPDIFKTADPCSELLRIFPDDEKKATVYFWFHYCKVGDLNELLEPESNENDVRESDYFFIAQESDEENINTAHMIEKKLAKLVTNRTNSTSKRKKPVITYYVANDSLKEKSNLSGENQKLDVAYLCPFGSLKENYTIETVLLKTITEKAETIENNYLDKIKNALEATGNIVKIDNTDVSIDVYNYWSSVARAIHIEYKAFCYAHYLNLSLSEKKLDDKEVKAQIEDINVKYETWVKINKNRYKDNPETEALFHRLAWLEHRRWNAFMRARGFRTLYLEENNYVQPKFLDQGLHACLVECLPEKANPGKEDYLDIVCKISKTDYKAYDYPQEDWR